MKTSSILIAFALCSVPAFAHEGGHDARGVVTSVDAHELTLKTAQGEEKFILTPETQFVKDGSPATLQDLKASDGVVDRKSTRLNSSHTVISYAVFCLKKKTTSNIHSLVLNAGYNQRRTA